MSLNIVVTEKQPGLCVIKVSGLYFYFSSFIAVALIMIS